MEIHKRENEKHKNVLPTIKNESSFGRKILCRLKWRTRVKLSILKKNLAFAKKNLKIPL